MNALLKNTQAHLLRIRVLVRFGWLLLDMNDGNENTFDFVSFSCGVRLLPIIVDEAASTGVFSCQLSCGVRLVTMK